MEIIVEFLCVIMNLNVMLMIFMSGLMNGKLWIG